MSTSLQHEGHGLSEPVSGEFEADVALFDRGRELDLLDAALARARSGRGSFVVLDGPPGSGRSRLLETVGARAADAGMRVLRASGHEPEREIPFGAALQLFENEVGRAEPAERARLLSGAAGVAEPLLADGPGARMPDEPVATLLHGLYRLCCHVGERAPLLLSVDDGEAVDEATMQLLLYLSHRLDQLPAVVLVGANVGAMHPDLSALVHHPRTTTVRLRPLDYDGTARWMRALAVGHVDDAACAACYALTRGDRSLLADLGAELSNGNSADSIRRVADMAPGRVAERVLVRLARVGPGAVELAEAIVTLGSGAQLRHVAALAGLDPEAAARLTERLVAAQILRGSDRLSFVQPLVARALDAHRAPTRRAQASLDAARLLRDDGAHTGPVAEQLLRARRTGSAWVVDVLESAAQTALDGGSPELAASYLTRALAEPPDPDRRHGMLAALGRAEAMAGAPEALTRLRRGAELLEPGSERAVTRLWAGRILLAQGRYRTAADSFQAALADTPQDDEPLRTQLSVAYATTARLGYSEPRDGLPEIWARGGAATPQGRLGLAHGAFVGALAGKPAEEMRGQTLQALGPGALIEEEGADGLGPYLAALTLTFAGDLQAAEAVLTAVIELGRERGSASGLVIAHAMRAATIMRRGRLPDALAEVHSSRSAHPDAWRDMPYPTHGTVALVHLERGAIDRAAAQVDRWERSADPTAGLAYMPFLMIRAHLRLLQRRPEEALADCLDCGRRAVALGITNPAVFPWRSQGALALVQMRRREQAVTLAARELELARSFGAPETVGKALHVLGLAEDGTAGQVLLEEAVAQLESSQAILPLARALIDYGATLRKASRRQTAREPLRRGLELAKRCQADGLVRRALEELATAGARPRRVAVSGAAALTTRERQTAELAGRGLSNRDIADALVVTLKTVEWHLHQAYRKLGITSRQQLGAALEEAQVRTH